MADDLEEGSESSKDALFRQAFEVAPQGVALVTTRGRFIDVNPALCRLVGYAREELIGRAFAAITVADDAEASEAARRSMLAGESIRLQKRYRHKDGHVVPAVVHGAPRRDADGRVVGFISHVEDLSAQVAAREELRRVEAARRREETRYRSLAENSSVGIWHIDTAGHTVYANPVMCRMLEVAGPDELEGHTFHRYFTADSLERMAEEHATRASGRASDYEVDLVGARGALRSVLVSGAPVSAGAGDLDGLIGTFVDMTERRRLAQEVRQLQKMEMLGQLAAGVAHDFNNLLTVIQGHLDPDVANLPAGDQAESLAAAADAARRAELLTRQLLLFSRRQPMRPVRVNVPEAVSDLFGLVQRLVGGKIDVDLDNSRVPLLVSADPAMIDSVLVNLAVNARDAMPAGGVLGIRVAREAFIPVAGEEVPAEKAMCRLTVEDTGAGIPEDVLPRIFEPFFTTKLAGHGTGLGLATAYGIVRQHGGQMRVETAPGVGTRFDVYLPLVESGPDDDALPVDPA